MKRIKILTLFMSAAFASGASLAGGGAFFGGSADGNMPEGSFYGGASVGQATTNCMIDDVFQTEKNCSNQGWKAFGGYRFSPNISIEGTYYHLGDVSETDHRHPHPSQAANLPPTSDKLEYHAKGKSTALSVAGIYSLPLMDNLEVFGKAGAIHWKSEGTMSVPAIDAIPEGKASVKGTSLLLGAGASYQFTENWGIRGEYERFQRKDVHDERRNVDLISVGATFSTY